MQKRASNSYLNFTRKERNGIVLLLLILLLLTATPFIYPLVFKENPGNAVNIQHELTALRSKQKQTTKKYYSNDADEDKDRNESFYPAKKGIAFPIKGVLFDFDPNTLSTEGWKKLGLRDKTISTIQHFISKGGKFRKPEDIKKIWGLHEDEVERLLPFIKIAAENSSTRYGETKPVFNKYEQKRSVEMIDINLADTNAFISLPGIGSKLASRIIGFREKLGGFYKIEQLAETFGLADSVFQKIRPRLVLHDMELIKLNINTATLDQLKQHPYIRYNLANAIIQYRNQHGPFTEVLGIKKIMLVNDELYEKVSSYLTIE